MDLLKMAGFKKKPPLNMSHSHSHSNGEESIAIAIPTASPAPPFPAQTQHQSQPHNENEQEEEEGEYEEEEEEDDFITNEVKRRLKELRKNTFMVLIPEEEDDNQDDDADADDEQGDQQEAEDASAFDFGLEGLNAWLCGFDSLYDKYCQRMLFFDRIIITITNAAITIASSTSTSTSTSTSISTSTHNNHVTNGSPTSRSRSPANKNKLTSTLRNLSFKRRDPHPHHPHQSLETAYVAQLSLSWEALHCQYAQLNLKISSHPVDASISYSRAAQAFQQFQVLLQRFIETEPFEPGSRVDIYTRSRAHLSKLLQVPNLQGLGRGDQPREESEPPIVATDLIKVLEESILTFRLFLKKDKTKSVSFSVAHSGADGTSIHQVQASLDKKEMRVKELFKKKKGWKSKTWPHSPEEVELVLALTDIKVVSRVLHMTQLSKEQLLWCEEKMSKIDLSSDGKLRRDASPILFPC